MTIPPVPNQDFPDTGLTDVDPVPGKDEPIPGTVPPDGGTAPAPDPRTTDM